MLRICKHEVAVKKIGGKVQKFQNALIDRGNVAIKTGSTDRLNLYIHIFASDKQQWSLDEKEAISYIGADTACMHAYVTCKNVINTCTDCSYHFTFPELSNSFVRIPIQQPACVNKIKIKTCLYESTQFLLCSVFK